MRRVHRSVKKLFAYDDLGSVGVACEITNPGPYSCLADFHLIVKVLILRRVIENSLKTT